MKSFRKNFNKKNFLFNGLLLLISVTFSILALEQSYRFYLFGMASFSIAKMNSIVGTGESGFIMPSDNLEIVYEMKPNLDTYNKLTKFKTNSAGLRDKEYTISKPSHVFRVAVIGDSYVLPDGVELEEAFHSLLEERLNKEQKNITYEFINFGVGGYNLRQYVAVIKYKALGYDPDLILVGFCPRNDQYIPDEKIFEQRYRVKPRTYPFFHFFSIEALGDIFRRGTYYDDDIYFLEKDLTRNKPFSDMQKSYMLRMFSEMSGISAQNDIPIVVIYLDNFYNEKFADSLEELVLKKNLYFVNASLPFQGRDIHEYIIYPIDSHPNGKAHRLFADVLYDYLFVETDLLNRATE